MNSELDRIKSTITISLGTKNRLRKLKGGESYESYINTMLRRLQQLKNEKNPNTKNDIEIQKFKRKTGVYSFKEFKIIFTYNKYNQSQNFLFDISIEKVRKKGKIISYEDYLEEISAGTGKSKSDIDITYFELLQVAIRKEIEPLFKHRGRFEDYYSWEKEFKTLNLPKKTFEEDVMEKLNNYKEGQGT